MREDRPIRNIAILTSGKSRGSNFLAIYNYFHKEDLPVRISFVTVSKPQAPIVVKCRELGIESLYLSTKDMNRFETALHLHLQNNKVELIALAGFLKKLSANFIREFGKPILNIHPALLPLFGGAGMYGERVHQAVFAAGEKESGASVHLVNENYDAGEIVSQQRVSIVDCHSPEEIAARVLKIEHQIYAPAIWKVLCDQGR